MPNDIKLTDRHPALLHPLDVARQELHRVSPQAAAAIDDAQVVRAQQEELDFWQGVKLAGSELAGEASERGLPTLQAVMKSQQTILDSFRQFHDQGTGKRATPPDMLAPPAKKMRQSADVSQAATSTQSQASTQTHLDTSTASSATAVAAQQNLSLPEMLQALRCDKQWIETDLAPAAAAILGVNIWVHCHQDHVTVTEPRPNIVGYATAGTFEDTTHLVNTSNTHFDWLPDPSRPDQIQKVKGDGNCFFHALAAAHPQFLVTAGFVDAPYILSDHRDYAQQNQIYIDILRQLFVNELQKASQHPEVRELILSSRLEPPRA